MSHSTVQYSAVQYLPVKEGGEQAAVGRHEDVLQQQEGLCRPQCVGKYSVPFVNIFWDGYRLDFRDTFNFGHACLRAYDFGK